MDLNYTIQRLIGSLSDLNGTEWDLPKSAISKGSQTYIVTGRWDRGTMHPETEPELVKGSPIDIIAHYIGSNDYFSCNRYGDETDNVYANRRLILASDFAENGQKWAFANPDDVFRFTRKINFHYKDGVLVPEELTIEPKEIDLEYELLDELKTRDGFSSQAREYLEQEKVTSLLNHLF